MTIMLATQEAEIRKMSSKPAQANNSWDPVLETNKQTNKKTKPSQKKGWWSGSRCKPRVQIPILKKRKRKISREGKQAPSHYPKVRKCFLRSEFHCCHLAGFSPRILEHSETGVGNIWREILGRSLLSWKIRNTLMFYLFFWLLCFKCFLYFPLLNSIKGLLCARLCAQ
jgi:hypothetical protein